MTLKLTPRQRECAYLVAEGCSNAEIAERLTLTPKTAGTYMGYIYRYYGVDPGLTGGNRIKLVDVIREDLQQQAMMGET